MTSKELKKTRKQFRRDLAERQAKPKKLTKLDLVRIAKSTDRGCKW